MQIVWSRRTVNQHAERIKINTLYLIYSISSLILFVCHLFWHILYFCSNNSPTFCQNRTTSRVHLKITTAARRLLSLFSKNLRSEKNLIFHFPYYYNWVSRITINLSSIGCGGVFEDPPPDLRLIYKSFSKLFIHFIKFKIFVEEILSLNYQLFIIYCKKLSISIPTALPLSNSHCSTSTR